MTAGLVDALTLAFSGALLQAGMGVMTYTEMGERLDVVVATILNGNTHGNTHGDTRGTPR